MSLRGRGSLAAVVRTPAHDLCVGADRARVVLADRDLLELTRWDVAEVELADTFDVAVIEHGA